MPWVLSEMGKKKRQKRREVALMAFAIKNLDQVHDKLVVCQLRLVIYVRWADF